MNIGLIFFVCFSYGLVAVLPVCGLLTLVILSCGCFLSVCALSFYFRGILELKFLILISSTLSVFSFMIIIILPHLRNLSLPKV